MMKYLLLFFLLVISSCSDEIDDWQSIRKLNIFHLVMVW